MPPELLDVLDACPHTRTWKTRGRPAEPDLAGLRDRALLLVGFFAALRRSELAALTADQITEHPNGLVLALPRSKTNQHGDQAELVVLPRAGHPARCPVTALTPGSMPPASATGPVLRPVSKGNRPLPRPLHPESVNALVQAAVARAGLDPSRLQRPQPARRLRHLRPPARRLRPGHRPPDPPPLPGHRRHLRPHPRSLGRQRRHPTRAVTDAWRPRAFYARAGPSQRRHSFSSAPVRLDRDDALQHRVYYSVCVSVDNVADTYRGGGTDQGV